MNKPLQDWRCSNCNALLMRYEDGPGPRVQIKCSRCNAINERQGLADTADSSAKKLPGANLKHLVYCTREHPIFAVTDNGGLEIVGHKGNLYHFYQEYLEIECYCGSLTTYTAKFQYDIPLGIKPLAPSALKATDLIAVMEQRWEAMSRSKSLQRVSIALGLRFDVFTRDGFRCRYCGAAAEDGALLHVDHVMPQSKGGLTTLDNLVTACFECNLGKSAKVIDAATFDTNRNAVVVSH